jgi:MFS family permease
MPIVIGQIVIPAMIAAFTPTYLWALGIVAAYAVVGATFVAGRINGRYGRADYGQCFLLSFSFTFAISTLAMSVAYGIKHLT